MDKLDDVRILLVEDDHYTRMIMGQMFNVLNIRHDEAVNGEQAVEMSRQKVYDMILMDISMPVMDGFETTRKIRELPGYFEIPVIALTAVLSEKAREGVISGLFTDLVIKPPDPDKLKKTVTEMARRKRVG